MNTLKSFTTKVCALVAFAFIFSTSAKAQTLNDPQIASVAVTGNQIDVDYANIALKKATNKEVKKFAETMKKDHTMVIKEAVALAKKLGVTPETNSLTKTLLAEQTKEVKVLNSKKGRAFDKAYIDNEVAFHAQVIGAVEKVLIPQTKNPQLKSLLQSAVPLFKSHLEMAQMIAKKF